MVKKYTQRHSNIFVVVEIDIIDSIEHVISNSIDLTLELEKICLDLFGKENLPCFSMKSFSSTTQRALVEVKEDIFQKFLGSLTLVSSMCGYRCKALPIFYSTILSAAASHMLV
ncbi:hypothetical protein ADUPG1_008342 [Aduncisulcus paluster]|uniref:Uncharacterized protein n=1 Tax=Aduncisulcus paluster TaxID=2918883 RepID=A0ABQ5KRL5_9EUKA|nr:hypothetical protein ADUPG1_008342 [Aduncisulcus paluster]